MGIFLFFLLLSVNQPPHPNMNCVICPNCRNFERDNSLLPLYFLPHVTAEIGINLQGYSERTDGGMYPCEYEMTPHCPCRTTYRLVAPTSVDEIGPHIEGEDKEDLMECVVRRVLPSSQVKRYCWTHLHMQWQRLFRQMKHEYKCYLKEYKRKKKNQNKRRSTGGSTDLVT